MPKKTATFKVEEHFLGHAIIQEGYLAILLPIDALPRAVQASIDLGLVEGNFKVTDPEKFAADLVREINKEDEIGNTPLLKMLDECVQNAVNDGADGVEYL